MTKERWEAALETAVQDVVDAARYYADEAEVHLGRPPTSAEVHSVREEIAALQRELAYVDGDLEELAAEMRAAQPPEVA